MSNQTGEDRPALSSIVYATGETPKFRVGDAVRILARAPVGHYRVPIYLRGKAAVIEKIIAPTAVDNEEEAFGRNAGNRGHYYRIAVGMSELWPEYHGSAQDGLRIEVFESWIEGVQS